MNPTTEKPSTDAGIPGLGHAQPDADGAITFSFKYLYIYLVFGVMTTGMFLLFPVYDALAWMRGGSLVAMDIVLLIGSLVAAFIYISYGRRILRLPMSAHFADGKFTCRYIGATREFPLSGAEYHVEQTRVSSVMPVKIVTIRPQTGEPIRLPFSPFLMAFLKQRSAQG